MFGLQQAQRIRDLQVQLTEARQRAQRAELETERVRDEMSRPRLLPVGRHEMFEREALLAALRNADKTEVYQAIVQLLDGAREMQVAAQRDQKMSDAERAHAAGGEAAIYEALADLEALVDQANEQKRD